MKSLERSADRKTPRRYAAGLRLTCLLSIALAGGAQAAQAPSHAWPTSITGTGSTVGAARTFNWQNSPYGSPGVTATQTITSRVAAPSAAGCAFMGGGGTGVGSQPNYLTYTEPDVPAYANFASACIEGSNGFVSSFVFNKPLIAPVFHFHNLDASRFAIGGTSTTGAAIGLTAIARNTLMDVSGTVLNNTVQPATQVGCNNNSASDPINGACGSFRVTAASGMIRSLTLNNNATPPVSAPSGFNDGLNWTVSFPTAPLTKQFSPASIQVGQTSQLTFSIANPNESASVTLTPLDFTDDFPAGLTVASAGVTNNGSCGTPAVTDGSGGALAVGATSVRATNISVAPGTTCAITVVVTAPAGSYTNDASNMSSSVGNLVPGGSTTLAVAGVTDLAITKTDGSDTYSPGFDATYTIVVSNNGPGAVVGAQVSDPLPAGVSSASWTCGNATNGGVCGAASGTGAIATTADLPVGASVTYTLSLGIPVAYTGSLTNTATVAPPAGMTDTNPDNDEASDTNTMAPPPTSGACAPRRVIGNTTFSLAPFAISGTVQKSGAPNGWNPDNPWSTLGGNYVFRWNFSQPVPANWIRFVVSDVGATNYQTTPARFTVTLGAGSTATPADFSLVTGWHPTFSDLAYNASSGVMTYVPSGEIKQAGALQGNSTDTVTSITITTSNVVNADYIVNLLYVRPSCLTLEKVSEGGTGPFTIDMTNVAEADGTVVPSTTLTTTTPGTPVAAAMLFFSPVPGAVMDMTEAVPPGWNNTAAMCTDQNAGVTGNPTVIGNFVSPTITIPAENVLPEADIHCRFTNAVVPEVDLSITKDDGATTYVPGFDVNYTIVASNAGPDDVTGAQVRDPLPAGITTASWTCGNATDGGVCGAASGTGAIDTTADLPAGATVTYTLNMIVPPTYTGDLTNTATVTAPSGFTEADTSDNADSDTDTMEPPPTSGACSPRVVVQGASFTLAPFPTTGSVQKSAARGWQTANPWATQGGNYTFRWTFSQPIPVSWIRFAVVDVNETSGLDYDANPPVFSITLAGGTATAADFSLADGDLIYSGGALRFRPGGPYRQSGYLQGNGGDTVTSITIVSTGVANGDNIANSLYVRPACVTLQKTSEGGTGSFQIDMSNVVQANGTAVPATTLATTTPSTPVSSPEYYSIIDLDVTLSEVVPAGWDLDSAICTDQNAGSTGNPTVIGNFASPAITIPADNVRPEADIRCLFTNELMPAADLAVVKTVAPDQVFSGQQVVYTLQVTNNGPESADGALLTDPQPVGLDCSAGTLTCGSATGGAVCPPSPTIVQLQGTGVPIPTLPMGGSVAFTLTCTVTASGQP